TKKARSVARGTNALASAVVLVCRTRDASAGVTTRRDFLQRLKSDLPGAARELQKANVAPVDLAQASIGPGMAIFSEYAKVLEADGSSMSVRTALGLINRHWMRCSLSRKEISTPTRALLFHGSNSTVLP